VGGLAGVAAINLPIFVELASGQAKLSSMSCAVPSSGDNVTLSVSPSIGEAAIGSIDVSQLNNFNQELAISQATMVNVLLIQANGKALINVGGDDWQSVAFSGTDIQNGTVKTVSTNDAIAATTSSLLKNLSLNVQVAGLGLGVPQVTATIQNSLAAVAPSLDGVLNSLEGLVGVGLGQADVRVNGIRCQNVALVQ
jgi:uncharacterized membrane protein